MTTKQNILITGATGSIGAELVKQLSSKNIAFKAMVRDKNKAPNLAAMPGVQVIEGDFNEPSSIENALAEINTAFLLTNSSEQAEIQQTSFVEAAAKAGVKHIVKLSQWAADESSPVRFLRYHAAVEKKIKESGIAYTFLRPNLFMQGLLSFKQTIQQQGGFYASIGDAKVSIVDIRDIASVAVEALTKEGHEAKTYNLTGPKSLTHGQMAAFLSDALGKLVAFTDVPPQAMLQALLAAHMPQWMAEGLIEDYAHYARGEASAISNDIQNVTGKLPFDFKTFAEDYRNVFLN